MGEGQPPLEYVNLVLCRDIYHCLPSELRTEAVGDIMRTLACIDVEARVNNLRARRGR